MKKLIISALSSVAILTLAACGAKTETAPDAAPQAAVGPTAAVVAPAASAPAAVAAPVAAPAPAASEVAAPAPVAEASNPAVAASGTDVGNTAKPEAAK